MRTIDEIIQLIQGRSSEIIENLSFESIEVYKFINHQFQTSNAIENYLFQFVYRSFYRLDNAGLTNEFKTHYFQLLENYRNIDNFDFHDILMQLFEIPNYKQQNTFQFSFVTKMLNTIDNNEPIFDNEVAKVFGFPKPRHSLTFQEKLNFFMNKFEIIRNLYRNEIVIRDLGNTLDAFDEKFSNNNLTVNKKFDFIFWSFGKLM